MSLYENYQVLIAATGLKLIQSVTNSNLKLLLDDYHMNVDGNNSSVVLISTAEQLGFFHIGNSNS